EPDHRCRDAARRFINDSCRLPRQTLPPWIDALAERGNETPLPKSSRPDQRRRSSVSSKPRSHGGSSASAATAVSGAGSTRTCFGAGGVSWGRSSGLRRRKRGRLAIVPV